MSKNEILMWASTQPVWVQVFIALVLFFVVLPLIFTILGWLFVGVASLKSPSTYSKTLTTKPDIYKDGGLDDTEVHNQLLAVLCVLYAGKNTEDQMREYIGSKTDAEKRAMLRNPRLSRINERLQEEVIAPIASVPCNGKKL